MLSKHLFHFAMVHEKFSATGDIIQGLLPIFIPALKGKSGTIFSAQDFCNDIDAMYGLKMHPYVAEEMIPKFVNAQILDEVDNARLGKQYIISRVTDFDDEKSKESFIEIYKGFFEVASNILIKADVETSTINYDYEFSRRLARVKYSESSGISLDKTDTVGIDVDSLLDYSFYRFVEKIVSEGGEYKKVLESAYSGAILAEVVLSLQEPDIKKENIKGKLFYIDAPILLNLLGFNDDYSTHCSSEIVKQIKNYGGVLTTSDTYIDEAQNSIRQAVRNYDEKGDRSSSINRFMFKNPTKIAEVRYAQTKVRNLLESEGFNLEPRMTNLSSKITTQRAKSLEDKIVSILDWYKSDEASLHDAETVTFVVSDHGYSSFSQMATSKSFYVTNNDRQVYSVNKYLYASGIFKRPELSPILSERNLAVLLWVLAGGKGVDVSSLSLISNCSRAMDMNKDAFRQFSQFINDLRPGKSNIYEDLIRNDRAMYCLMDEVGGDFSRISKDNAISIADSALAQLLIDTKREAEDKKNAAENSVKALESELEMISIKHGKALAVIADKSKVEMELKKSINNGNVEGLEWQREKENIEIKNKAFDNERNILKQTIANLSGEISAVKHELDLKSKSSSDFAMKMSELTEKIMILSISIFICIVVFRFKDVVTNGFYDNEYITLKPGLVEFFPYLVMFLTFWKVPEFLFNKPIKYLSGKVYSYFNQ